jgi:hypothetical protein
LVTFARIFLGKVESRSTWIGRPLIFLDLLKHFFDYRWEMN